MFLEAVDNSSVLGKINKNFSDGFIETTPFV